MKIKKLRKEWITPNIGPRFIKYYLGKWIVAVVTVSMTKRNWHTIKFNLPGLENGVCAEKDIDRIVRTSIQHWLLEIHAD